MILKLRRVFEVNGERVSFDYPMPADSIESLKSKGVNTPIMASGEALNRAGVVELNAFVRFNAQHECDRCLTEFEREYDLNFTHTLVTRSYTDDDELIVCENYELDLDELLTGDILLSFPTKILCREDCKGLCPVCGKDLNKGDCPHC